MTLNASWFVPKNMHRSDEGRLLSRMLSSHSIMREEACRLCTHTTLADRHEVLR